jgi:hypothetical protein
MSNPFWQRNNDCGRFEKNMTDVWPAAAPAFLESGGSGVTIFYHAH